MFVLVVVEVEWGIRAFGVGFLNNVRTGCISVSMAHSKRVVRRNLQLKAP